MGSIGNNFIELGQAINRNQDIFNNLPTSLDTLKNFEANMKLEFDRLNKKIDDMKTTVEDLNLNFNDLDFNQIQRINNNHLRDSNTHIAWLKKRGEFPRNPPRDAYALKHASVDKIDEISEFYELNDDEQEGQEEDEEIKRKKQIKKITIHLGFPKQIY